MLTPIELHHKVTERTIPMSRVLLRMLRAPLGTGATHIMLLGSIRIVHRAGQLAPDARPSSEFGADAHVLPHAAYRSPSPNDQGALVVRIGQSFDLLRHGARGLLSQPIRPLLPDGPVAIALLTRVNRKPHCNRNKDRKQPRCSRQCEWEHARNESSTVICCQACRSRRFSEHVAITQHHAGRSRCHGTNNNVRSSGTFETAHDRKGPGGFRSAEVHFQGRDLPLSDRCSMTGAPRC